MTRPTYAELSVIAAKTATCRLGFIVSECCGYTYLLSETIAALELIELALGEDIVEKDRETLEMARTRLQREADDYRGMQEDDDAG